MSPDALCEEIAGLLMEHAGHPVDRVALFMFLNTVPGGHYAERYTETEIGAALDAMLAAGTIEAEEHGSEAPCIYHIAGSRHTRLPIL